MPEFDVSLKEFYRHDRAHRRHVHAFEASGPLALATAYDMAVAYVEMERTDGARLLEVCRGEFPESAEPISTFLDEHFAFLIARGIDYSRLLKGVKDGTLKRKSFVARGSLAFGRPTMKAADRVVVATPMRKSAPPMDTWTPSEQIAHLKAELRLAEERIAQLQQVVRDNNALRRRVAELERILRRASRAVAAA